ncbi:MAG: hypothetical protein JXR73_08750 [Candidatus Omnitrophica bacterium]|nr:hypothetical protein [Candidatus Omnitrophota bacterium]
MSDCDPWRQGSVLTTEHAKAFDLCASPMPDERVVVISHDCDIRSSQETTVEVIIGNVIARADPMYENARHPRVLHLTFFVQEQNKGEIYVELRHSNRRTIQKDEFSKHSDSPDPNLILSSDEKRALKQWLAARYGRPAFPNAFERRLKEKKIIYKKIAHILKPNSKYLVGLFFDLGEDRNCELEDDKPYNLSIYLVYDAIEGGILARESAEKTAKKLETLFYDAFGKPSEAAKLALENCGVIADTHFSLADIRKIDQWRIEYISLQNDPSDDFIETGKIPV